MLETDTPPACSPGCKCALHFGLAEFMEQLTGKDYGLARAPLAGQEHRLNVQTIGPSPSDAIPLPSEHVCADPYTCDCLRARRERKEAAEAAAERADAAQPWVPRPPRALRGAAA